MRGRRSRPGSRRPARSGKGRRAPSAEGGRSSRGGPAPGWGRPKQPGLACAEPNTRGQSAPARENAREKPERLPPRHVTVPLRRPGKE
ncbi:uncharacterized protein LOC108581675 [Papio anubis]|uniref:uncharacterized protein LOC108581675 n=1 Tax=Papio anubis TaxID=9555 RepID=UPI00083EE73E|nr:uncharacterized protein LOC108581675 [Papio anubis]